jgi:hypothetical protein
MTRRSSFKKSGTLLAFFLGSSALADHVPAVGGCDFFTAGLVGTVGVFRRSIQQFRTRKV